MSQLPRRDVAQALLDRLLAADGLAGVVKTSGRGLKHWKDLQEPEDNPALFICAETSDPRSEWGKPPAWHLKFQLYLYCAAAQADGSAQAQLDDLVDAIDAALRPDKLSGRQTLGDKVFNCRIDKVETDGGLLGEQAVGWLFIEVRNH